jgi:hypothetical protein
MNDGHPETRCRSGLRHTVSPNAVKHFLCSSVRTLQEVVTIKVDCDLAPSGPVPDEPGLKTNKEFPTSLNQHEAGLGRTPRVHGN